VGVIEMVIKAWQPVSSPPTGDHKKDIEMLGEHNKDVDAWKRLHCGNADLIQKGRSE